MAKLHTIFVLFDDCACVILAVVLDFIHTYRGISDISPRQPRFTKKTYLAIRNTADVTDGKPITVWLQSISGGSAANPLVAFYDIHGRKGEVLFFCSVSDTTRD
jgi:hypothetical protein